MKISGKKHFYIFLTIFSLLFANVSNPLAENPEVSKSQDIQNNQDEFFIIGFFILSASAASILFFTKFDKDDDE